MQNDEMIWQVINHQFCSFKTTLGTAKSDPTQFCRHAYSVTGLCNRTSCPLANSRYAVVREEKGRVSLYLKTVERAHSPKNLWERIALSRNYSKALAQLDEHLAFFPKALIHRNKQRLTKVHQYLMRMRKIELQARAGRKAKRTRLHRKVEQREERRERKALVAAKLERAVEAELVQRLAKGTYGDLYNFADEKAAAAYQKALRPQEESSESETEEMESETEDDEGLVEYVEDLDSEEDELEEDVENMDYLGNGQWGRRMDEDDQSSEDDASDESSTSSSPTDKKKPAKKKMAQPPSRQGQGPRIEIEYEEENEEEATPQAEMVTADNTAW